MAIKSLLVNFGIHAPAAPLARLALDLADRFDATLTGFAAADITPMMTTADGMIIDGEAMERERAFLRERMTALENEFRELAGANRKVEWRAVIEPPTRRLVHAASAADIIVTASPGRRGNHHHEVDLGDLLLNAGRPVLIAAADAQRVAAEKALVAWKDSREARRAVADAVPFLALAGEVLVVTVDDAFEDDARQSLKEVLRYLLAHGVKCRGEVISGRANGEGLVDLAKSFGADLLVAGAYGHSRLREWVFGGVTRSLLDQDGINRLMSN